jgi:soluble lytic murein transglycosylase-like protein
MPIDGVGRVMSRIEEIRSRIDMIIGPASEAVEPPASQDTFHAVMEQANASAVRRAPEELRPLIDSTAARYNLPPQLLESVARRESAFNPRAVSPVGAQGLMQIMPGTQREVGVSDPFDPSQSLDGGAKYLRMMLDRFGGRLDHALAAYNAGPERVEQHGGVPPISETRDYVRRILSDLDSGSFEDEP